MLLYYSVDAIVYRFIKEQFLSKLVAMDENLVESEKDSQLLFKEAYLTTEPPLKVPNESVNSKDTNYDYQSNLNLSRKLRPLTTFKIYEDPKNSSSSLSDTDSLQATMVLHKRGNPKTTRPARTIPGKPNGCRFVSDTVLTKRVVSSDNKQAFTRENSTFTSSELPDNHFTLPHASNKVNCNKRVPLVRKALWEISPLPDRKISDSDQTINLRKKLLSEEQGDDSTDGMKNQNNMGIITPNNECIQNNVNNNDSDKENVAPCLIDDYALAKELSDNINSCSTSRENQQQRDNVDEPIHLFTPEYFWNRLFSSKESAADISLEDFYLLLYDYERLWNLFVVNSE